MQTPLPPINPPLVTIIKISTCKARHTREQLAELTAPRVAASSAIRAFFNYITGGAKAPPAPMVAPPLNHFGPPSQSPFSLKYKQNMEFRREV